MRILHLRREKPTADGTFGVLDLGPFGLFTMEDDWKDNQPRESCIPVGNYPLHRTIYHKHGYETFEVMDVPGRSRILIHPANTEEDVEGCIGVGLRRGTMRVQDEDDPMHPYKVKQAIVESQAAFRRFMESMTGLDEAVLDIYWAADAQVADGR